MPRRSPHPPFLAQAQWVWPDALHWDLYNCYALFRKRFTLSALPRRAPLAITADQSYHLYLNGQFVCRGPARGFQAHWPYDTVDVAPYLRRGGNVLAVRAHNPGFSNFQYLTQGFAGLLVSAQWGKVRLFTDKSWKCRRQSGVSKNAIPTSMQLFCQEHVDARMEPPDWMQPGFNDRGWSGGCRPAPLGHMPWDSLEPRMIPLLREQMVQPPVVLGEASHPCVPGYQVTRDVFGLRALEPMGHRPVIPYRGAIHVSPVGKGRFRSYLIDLGKTYVGNFDVEVWGARGAEIVDLCHYETINQTTLQPDLEIPTWSKMAFGSRLICRPGKNHHEFYHLFGFRYALVTVRDATRSLKLKLALRQAGYPLDIHGGLRSSEAQLESIWRACAWTQQCCSLDSYVDTPWREQAQWWGDARVQAWNTFHLCNDARLLRRGIRCIASQTTPGGLTYGHAPTMAHNCIVPDFTLTWMLTLWDYYWQTGSLEAFVTHQPTVENALQYFEKQTHRLHGLVGFDRRYWLFLDWTDLFRDGYSTVYNLWLLEALDKLALMYRLTRGNTKAAKLQAWARRLRHTLRGLVGKDGLVRDGITWGGRTVPQASVHAQTLAIWTKLSPATESAMFQKVLRPFIRDEIHPDAYPSAYWVTFIFSVLIQRGHGDEVVRFIRKHWSAMAKYGTTWENFKPVKGAESRSHAWSAHPLVHLMATIGGLTQTGPAWREVRFAPTFVGEYGGATIPAPAGTITSRWDREGKVIRVELVLPRDVRATVILPGIKPGAVTGRNRWTVLGYRLKEIRRELPTPVRELN